MSREVAFVTGAGGEMGRLLVPELTGRGQEVVALDLTPLPADIRNLCVETREMDILDSHGLGDLIRRHRPAHVFHLAAVLSSKAERNPDLAHRVNVEGTYGLIRQLLDESQDGEPPLRFLFPSSIAVYGLPDVETKDRQGAVRETDWTVPSAMYGCNKLYCELIGSYLSNRRPGGPPPGLDFRAIRFPGLISAETLPAGGTTDYAPEMIHAAAQGESYACFVEPRTRLPFMTMPDAIDALLALDGAPASALSTRVYNIRGFSASADEIRRHVLKSFPGADVTFAADPVRQAIVDSWPADIDDGLARRDWGLSPRHDLDGALGEYLIPALRERYVGADG